MKWLFHIFLLCFLTISISASAKIKSKTYRALHKHYTPAEPHEGLEIGSKKLVQEKLHSFVVVGKPGIVAERAYRFISWGEYDYRATVVRGDKIKTRGGKKYTKLMPGDVLTVVGIEEFRNIIYIKLLTPEVYKPENRKSDKNFSRVSAKLGLVFPKQVLTNDDAAKVLLEFKEWIVPFKDYAAAKTYSISLTGKAPKENAEVNSLSDESENATQEEIDQLKKRLQDLEERVKQDPGE